MLERKIQNSERFCVRRILRRTVGKSATWYIHFKSRLSDYVKHCLLGCVRMGMRMGQLWLHTSTTSIRLTNQNYCQSREHVCMSAPLNRRKQHWTRCCVVQIPAVKHPQPFVLFGHSLHWQQKLQPSVLCTLRLCMTMAHCAKALPHQEFFCAFHRVLTSVNSVLGGVFAVPKEPCHISMSGSCLPLILPRIQ